MDNCIGRSRSWRRRSSAGIIPLCKDEKECCVPVASQIQQQKEHKSHWHRQLSPVKLLPHFVITSSFILHGKRDGNSAAKEEPKQPQKMRQKLERMREGGEEEITDGRDVLPFPTTLLSAAVELSDNGSSSTHQKEASSPGGMCSSFLISPAWYRDSDGRTGFRPEFESSSNGHLQESPIKENDKNVHRKGNGIERCLVPFPSSPPAVPISQRSFSSSASCAPQLSANKGQIHLPKQINMDKAKAEKREGEEEKQRRRTKCEGTANQRQQKQKIVKFAETIKINEIAPREEGSLLLTLPSDNSPIVSSACFRVEEEWPQSNGADRQHDFARLELLIDKFFHHCQSNSTLKECQQNSIYDNIKSIGKDEERRTEANSEKWLHTKTKVLVQRGLLKKQRDKSEKNEIGREANGNEKKQFGRDSRGHSDGTMAYSVEVNMQHGTVVEQNPK